MVKTPIFFLLVFAYLLTINCSEIDIDGSESLLSSHLPFTHLPQSEKTNKSQGFFLDEPDGRVHVILLNGMFSFLACSTIYFFSVYFSPRLLPQTWQALSHEKRLEWHANGASIFAAMTVPFFAWSGFQEMGLFFDIHSNSVHLAQTSGLSLGYMTFDLLLLIIYAREFRISMGKSLHVLFFVHHLSSLCLFPWAILSSRGAYFINWYMFTEGANVFMVIRWFLVESQLTHTPLYIINGAVWIVAFFMIRIVPIPYLLYVYWSDDWSQLSNAEFWTCLLAIPFPMLLNIYWFYLMVEGILSFLFISKPKSD